MSITEAPRPSIDSASSIVERSETPPRRPEPDRWQRVARQLVHGRLAGIQGGVLELRDSLGISRFGNEETGLQATLEIHDPAFYTRLATGGSLGAGESYLDGEWTCDDLAKMVRIFARDDEGSLGMSRGMARLRRPLSRFGHWLRRNTRAGSRRNIEAHYDLSNDFFALWLDPTMSYSSGLFTEADMSLEDAQIAKIDRLCRLLQLQSDDHLLEIGTGWGSFAVHAAQNYGCRVTTTTISREQFKLACERVRAAGVEDRVTVLLSDYRDLEGKYSKLVSVEMIEAVGAEFFETFFAKCSDLLAPDGLMAIQAITIADRHYEQARDSVDFIKRYIFPGCCIPSVGAMHEAVTRATPLDLVQLDDFGEHYATTLRRWRERFLERKDEVHALGFDDRFCRMWEYYLAYCEGGFAERRLRVMHLVWAKPGSRRVANHLAHTYPTAS